MKKLASIVEHNRLILQLVWQADKMRFLYIFLSGFTGLPSLIVNVVAVKYIIDFLAKGDELNVIISLIVSTFVAVIIMTAISNALRIYLIPLSDRKIIDHLNLKVLRKAISFDLQECEKYDYYDLFAKAVYEAENRAIAIINSITGLFKSVINIGTLLALIIYLDPVIIVISFANFFFTFILNISIKKINYKLNQARVLSDRQINYVKRIVAEPQYSKEIRLYDMWGFLKEKYVIFSQELFITIKKNSEKLLVKTSIQNMLQSTVTMTTMFVLAYKIYKGQLTLGDFSALISASQQLSMTISQMITQVTDFYEHSLFVDNLVKFFSVESKIEYTYKINSLSGDWKNDEIAKFTNNALSFEKMITLNNVSYEYNHFTLKNINFSIAKGEKIAIVGSNGAGKTTLLKLISRLYDVSKGTICIDERNIKDVNIKVYRGLFGYVLQDFQYYAFSIAENILLRKSDEKSIENIVKNALEKVGLFRKISACEKGSETNITKEFDKEGIVLSGGEFQKIAIARAIARNSQILLCDEPSSALDPIAEDEILNRIFKEFQDKTIVIVSHRLSAIKHVDKIIVMDDGSIKEIGDHNSLMKLNGLYYQMFTTQAEKYNVN